MSHTVSSSALTAAAAAAAGSPAVIEIPIETAESGDGLPGGVAVATNGNPGLRTIELSSGRVREGFGRFGTCTFRYNSHWFNLHSQW